MSSTIAEIRVSVKSCPVSEQRDRLADSKCVKFHAVLTNWFTEQELEF